MLSECDQAAEELAKASSLGQNRDYIWLIVTQATRKTLANLLTEPFAHGKLAYTRRAVYDRTAEEWVSIPKWIYNASVLWASTCLHGDWYERNQYTTIGYEEWIAEMRSTLGSK